MEKSMWNHSSSSIHTHLFIWSNPLQPGGHLASCSTDHDHHSEVILILTMNNDKHLPVVALLSSIRNEDVIAKWGWCNQHAYPGNVQEIRCITATLIHTKTTKLHGIDSFSTHNFLDYTHHISVVICQRDKSFVFSPHKFVFVSTNSLFR